MKRPYWTLGHRLPAVLANPLFGDRQRFGCEIKEDDPDWRAWQDFYMNFYQNTQKQGMGKTVNDAGYRVLHHTDLTGKRVMELGPGILPHLQFWSGTPINYTIVDIKQELLDRSTAVLQRQGIPTASYLTTSPELPLKADQFDVVISFYSLEHLQPLRFYLEEIRRVLYPGGILVGAIPTEGGLAWGIGRFLTSRRYLKQHSSINPDKIICWEHPNFAETILQELDGKFKPILRKFWPLHLPMIDLNLIISFIYQKDTEAA